MEAIGFNNNFNNSQVALWVSDAILSIILGIVVMIIIYIVIIDNNYFI